MYIYVRFVLRSKDILPFQPSIQNPWCAICCICSLYCFQSVSSTMSIVSSSQWILWQWKYITIMCTWWRQRTKWPKKPFSSIAVEFCVALLSVTSISLRMMHLSIRAKRKRHNTIAAAFTKTSICNRNCSKFTDALFATICLWSGRRPEMTVGISLEKRDISCDCIRWFLQEPWEITEMLVFWKNYITLCFVFLRKRKTKERKEVKTLRKL